MNKILLMWSALFFSCFSYAADIDGTDIDGLPPILFNIRASVEDYFCNDPEAHEWAEEKSNLFACSKQFTAGFKKAASITKRSCESIGIALIAAGIATALHHSIPGEASILNSEHHYNAVLP